MSKVSKELLRDYVKKQNFSSSDEVLNAIMPHYKPFESFRNCIHKYDFPVFLSKNKIFFIV